MKNEDKVLYEYEDRFKEDLIHQFWHLVEELKKLNENLHGISVNLESIDDSLSQISIEIYNKRINL